MPLYGPSGMALHDTATGDARDYGLLAQSFSPELSAAGTAPATGVPWFTKIWIPRTITVSTIWLNVTVSGATLTAGANNAALYNSSGTQIAATADQSSAWASAASAKAMAVTTPVVIQGGPTSFVWVGLKSSGTTPAAFSRLSVTASLVNVNLTTATLRAFTNGSAAATTLMPASFTPSSNTSQTVLYWAAIS